MNRKMIFDAIKICTSEEPKCGKCPLCGWGNGCRGFLLGCLESALNLSASDAIVTRETIKDACNRVVELSQEFEYENQDPYDDYYKLGTVEMGRYLESLDRLVKTIDIMFK